MLPKPWSYWASQHSPDPQSSEGWFWPWIFLQASSVWQLKHVGNMGLCFKFLLAWKKWRPFFFIWIQVPCELSSCWPKLGSLRVLYLILWMDPLSPSKLSKWSMYHCLPPFFFFSNLFPCFIYLVSVFGYCHGLQLHSWPWVSFSTESWGLTGNEEGQRCSLLLLSAVWGVFSFHSALPLSPPFIQSLSWKSTPMEWLSGSWNNIQAFTYKLRVPVTSFTLYGGH